MAQKFLKILIFSKILKIFGVVRSIDPYYTRAYQLWTKVFKAGVGLVYLVTAEFSEIFQKFFSENFQLWRAKWAALHQPELAESFSENFLKFSEIFSEIFRKFSENWALGWCRANLLGVTFFKKFLKFSECQCRKRITFSDSLTGG